MKVNRVSYLHYVLIFAFALIFVTVGITLWMTYKQALVVYELNSARRLEAIGRTARPLLPDDAMSALPALNPASFPRQRPQDPISTQLATIEQANKLGGDDGGAFTLFRIEGGTPVPVATSKGSQKNWWLLNRGNELPALDRLQAGEVQHIRGQIGTYVGEDGIWTGTAMPLRVGPEGTLYVLLMIAENDYHADLAHFPWQDLVPVVIVVLLVVIGMSIFFAGHIISAIWTQMKAMRRLGDGQMEFRLARRRKDEFGLLFHTFNNLADNLRLRDENLQRTTRLLEAALDSGGVPALLCLPSGTIMYASESAAQLLGIPAGHLPSPKEGAPYTLTERLQVKTAEGKTTLDLTGNSALPETGVEIHGFWTKPTAAGETEQVAANVDFTLVPLLEDGTETGGYLLVFAENNAPSPAPPASELPQEVEHVASV